MLATNATRWIPFLLLAACNDHDTVSATGRCGELVDIMVRADAGARPFPPWPVNSAGDERLELWFPWAGEGPDDAAMIGYEPQPDGTYVERWSFARPGMMIDFQTDLSGDGRVDLVMASDRSASDLHYYPTEPDGAVSEQAVPIALLPGESLRTWRDLDEDGLVDRVSRVDDDYVWISAASGEVHAFGVQLGPDDLLWPLAGDRRLWGMQGLRGSEPGSRVMGRVEDTGFRAIWTGPSLSRGTGLHGDHYDVIESRAEGEEWPVSLVLVRVYPSGTELDRRTLARLSYGMLMFDYDGDGEKDLVFDPSDDDHHIRFGRADDEYTPAEPFPALADGDLGVMQSADVDGDGRVELLMAFAREEGEYQWSGLGWAPCDQVDGG